MEIASSIECEQVMQMSLLAMTGIVLFIECVVIARSLVQM